MHESISIAKALAFTWWSFVGWIIKIVFFPPIRTVLLRLCGARVGSDSVILNCRFSNVYHHGFRPLHIGKKVFIGDEAILDIRGGITLEDEASISNRVSIVTHMTVGYPDHPLTKYYPTKEARVTVKRGAYIGTGAIILPGVTVGEMSVVGAGAVVTKDVPSKTVVGGVPAKKIKNL